MYLEREEVLLKSLDKRCKTDEERKDVLNEYINKTGIFTHLSAAVIESFVGTEEIGTAFEEMRDAIRYVNNLYLECNINSPFPDPDNVSDKDLYIISEKIVREVLSSKKVVL